MRLKNRNVIIPGASRPIGRAIAKKFGNEGATLFLPVFDWPDSITEMEDEFNEYNFTFHILPCDLQKSEQVVELIHRIQEKATKIDFLINNIERGGMPIVHGSYDQRHNVGQWDIEINTTLKAKWLLYHHSYPLIDKSRKSSVVNISSVAALSGRSGPAAAFFNDAYSAANRAVSSFTETWAREAAPNIRVNEIMVGLIQNRHGENTRGWSAMTAEQKQQVKESILLGRTGLPDEVANTAFFLAVDATYMTGTILRLDGGFALGSQIVPPMPPGIL